MDSPETKKLAFLYPGQGSQRVGMGSELRESAPELFERYLTQTEAISALPIRQYCLEGPIEQLTRTEVAQPALLAISLALTDHARERGLRPDFVAGHSLGEYTAAVASGALSVRDGMVLVSRRGQLMADIQAARPGTMAAIVGLPAAQVATLCASASELGPVSLSYVYTPAQFVFSGPETAVEKLLAVARQAGAEAAVRLNVGAAFHSPLMQPVQERLAETMATVTWNDAEVPLACNASGQLLTRGEDIHRALLEQITHPVQWVHCIQTLLRLGCEIFLELGPGRVLTGLVRQIEERAEAFAADSPRRISGFLQAHPELASR
jgi:[acyl-carrier-protein] S-malonyltransferase